MYQFSALLPGFINSLCMCECSSGTRVTQHDIQQCFLFLLLSFKEEKKNRWVENKMGCGLSPVRTYLTRGHLTCGGPCGSCYMTNYADIARSRSEVMWYDLSRLDYLMFLVVCPWPRSLQHLGSIVDGPIPGTFFARKGWGCAAQHIEVNHCRDEDVHSRFWNIGYENFGLER